MPESSRHYGYNGEEKKQTKKKKTGQEFVSRVMWFAFPSSQKLSSSEDFLKLLRKEKAYMHRILLNIRAKQNNGELLPTVDHFWYQTKPSKVGFLS